MADAVGSASYVAREIVGVEELVDFTAKEDPIERLANRFGAAIGTAFAKASGLGSGPQLR